MIIQIKFKIIHVFVFVYLPIIYVGDILCTIVPIYHSTVYILPLR